MGNRGVAISLITFLDLTSENLLIRPLHHINFRRIHSSRFRSSMCTMGNEACP